MEESNVKILRELMTRSEPILVDDVSSVVVFDIEVPHGTVRLSFDKTSYTMLIGGE